MADYYTQAVCNNPDTLLFDDKIEAMFAFLERGNFEKLCEVMGSSHAAVEVLVEFAKIHDPSKGEESIREFFQTNSEEDVAEIEVEMLFDARLSWNYDDEGPREIDGKVWKQRYLYAEEYIGDLDASFLQWAIRQMPSEIEWIVVEYANTCSKMRPDGYGGGAWFITRTDFRHMHTGSWVEQQIHEFQEGKAHIDQAAMTDLLNQMDRERDG